MIDCRLEELLRRGILHHRPHRVKQEKEKKNKGKRSRVAACVPEEATKMRTDQMADVTCGSGRR